MWRYDDLAILAAVVESGGITAAEDRLQMPNSTISRRIAQLEAGLGVALLERTSRRVVLTPQGRDFFERSAPLLQQLKGNIDELLHRKASLAGRLKIAAPVFLGGELFSGWFVRFMHEHPEVHLDIDLSKETRDLLGEGVDVAIRIGAMRDSQYLTRYLGSLPRIFCATPQYLKSVGTIEQLDDLKGLPLLSFTDSWIEEGDIRQELPGLIKLRANDLKLIIEAALAGEGIAVVPKIAVQRQLDLGRLLPLLVEVRLMPEHDIYLAYASNRSLSVAARAFVDFIERQFA